MASASQPASAAQLKRGNIELIPATGLLQCLVVSEEANRRETFSLAASQGGWKSVPCSDVPAAEDCFRRMFLQLAVIDLQRSQQVPLEHLEKLIENMARTGNTLLVVCGDEGNLEQEVWARQAGVWMFIPGVEDGSELKTLLSEAHCLTQQMGLPTGGSGTERQANGFGYADEVRLSSRKPYRRRKAQRSKRLG